MRTAAAIFLLLPGCLYTGDINRAPTAALTNADLPQMIIKGAPLTLSGTMHDPEDGTNLFVQWNADLAAGGAAGCDSEIVRFDDVPGQPKAQFTFFRTGNWVVTFIAYDKLQAPSTLTQVNLTVVNSPPSFDASPDLTAQAAKDPECNSYVAGQPLPLFLGVGVTDLDENLSPPSQCDASQYSETLTYRWEILGMPSDAHAVLGPKPSRDQQMLGDAPCPPSPAPGLTTTFNPGDQDFPSAVCVYPDAGGQTTPDMYEVAVYVSDGTTEIRSNVFEAAVRADLPPCLTGASPAAGSYVVDRDSVQELGVTGVADDLDPFSSSGLSFVWSIWREQDPTWRQVPDWSLPSYQLDTSNFAVGEKVRVRVQPADRLGARASCDVDQDQCTTDSCLLPPGQLCQAWTTWDLELR